MTSIKHNYSRVDKNSYRTRTTPFLALEEAEETADKAADEDTADEDTADEDKADEDTDHTMDKETRCLDILYTMFF